MADQHEPSPSEPVAGAAVAPSAPARSGRVKFLLLAAAAVGGALVLLFVIIPWAWRADR
jgi:hypothetical protein